MFLRKSREPAGDNLSKKAIIIFNHTCKILCDIWVKHLDSAEFLYCYSNLISGNWGGSVSRVLVGIYGALLKCLKHPLLPYFIPQSSLECTAWISLRCGTVCPIHQTRLEWIWSEKCTVWRVRLTLYLQRSTPAIVYMIVSKWSAHIQAHWESWIFLLY